MYQQNTAIEIYSHQDMAFELPPPLRAAAAAALSRWKSLVCAANMSSDSQQQIDRYYTVPASLRLISRPSHLFRLHWLD